jgi:hypothetical protein
MRDGTKGLLDRAVDWFEPEPPDHDRVIERSMRRSRRRRVTAGVVAFVIFAAAASLLVSSFHAVGPAPAARTPTVSPDAVLQTTTLPLRSVFAIAASGPDVWLASYGHVLHVDGIRNELTGSFPVPGLDDQDSIAVAGSVWATVGSQHEVVEIDPSSGQVSASVSVPGYPVQIAADGSSVWVISATDGPGLLLRIDPTSHAITLRLRLSGTPKLGFAVGGGSVWIDGGGDLLQVGLDGTQSRHPGVAGSPLVFGADSVWVGNGSGLVRVDPTSGEEIARFATARPPIGLAFADGEIWVLTDTGSTSDTVYLPDAKDPSTVLRIDAATNRVDAEPVAVGTKPAWIAASEGVAWVAVLDEAKLIRVTPSLAASAEEASVEDGISAGIEWSLVAVPGSDDGMVLELRPAGSVQAVASVMSGGDLPAVSGYAFGEGEPTDAVVFGLVSPETTSVTLIPGQGLPQEDELTVPVPGSSLRAFALTAYVPIGIVRSKDPSGDVIAEQLLVLPGEEPVLRFVERFLSARVAGTGAEGFVDTDSLREFGALDIQPLYMTSDGARYTDFAILFIDAAGQSYEVGVRLDVDGGHAVEETLGVTQEPQQDGESRLLVTGARSGLTGP